MLTAEVCLADHGVGLPPSEPVLLHALEQPDEWYSSVDGKRIIDNIVSWQNPNGGWWKKYDIEHPRPAVLPPPDPHDAPPGDTEEVWRRTSTFDNNATHSELRILARAARVDNDQRYRDAFLKGLNFIFESQYPNGGWPQRFPLEDNYGRYITYNDNAMTEVMALLRDVAEGKPDFQFVTDDLRKKCASAFDRGLDCTLKCQVKQDGKLTAWAQQYYPDTLQPAPARAYELPAITGGESAPIVKLLTQIKNPDDRVQNAIEAAVQWYKRSEIHGKRFENVKGNQYHNGHDRLLVDDPTAPPLWARLYDLKTNEPFVSDRDGKVYKSVTEISWERRNGYRWYGTWGEEVFAAYAKWQQRDEHPTPKRRDVSVAPDGAADFYSVQGAIDSVPENNVDECVIHIRPGTYKERIFVTKSKPRISLIGEDASKTILTFDRNSHFIGHDGKEVGTFQSYSTRVDAPDFLAENVTFENTAGDHGQALALAANGDRQIFHNCRLLGWQDTLYAASGRQYYKDCYIEGRVDFIFGSATAVFDHCVIHSKNGGHVTAASTPQDHSFGYVFLDCKLTGEGAMADLGRPWRPYAATAFIRCEMGPHIKPEGWSIWRGNENHKTARYVEYENTGPGAGTEKRLDWTHQLTADEAAKYTVKNILSGHDDWDPQAVLAQEVKP